jgi:ubiquinone/menaquinone biosynthesis C-methylase UbiE
METGKVLLPEGYRLFEIEENKMLGKGEEEFNIKNRSFLEVDLYFAQGISRSIKEFLNKRPKDRIYVLDIAGGTESQAVKDIEKEFGSRVKAINVDIAQDIEKGKGADRIQGNAIRIPLADASMDVIYSNQFLVDVGHTKQEHTFKLNRILSEIARVLKSGGVVFLDDNGEFSGTGAKSEEKRKRLAEELGVVLETRDSAPMEHWQRKYFKWTCGFKPQKFLVMRKE